MIYEILGLACMGAMLQNFTPYQEMLKATYLEMKPFNCTLCMTFWLTVIPNFGLYGFRGVLYSFIEAVAAELIDRQLNKY